jgi:hypothetical protein
MTLVNRKQISLYKEAEAGLNSLVKQTAQVGGGLLMMLLLTGGNPPVFTLGLSVVVGIAFVAWSEEKRLTKFYVRQSDLRRADLSGANLDGADLSDANWKRANLDGANLDGADLSDANWKRVQVSYQGGADIKSYVDSYNLHHANRRLYIFSYFIIIIVTLCIFSTALYHPKILIILAPIFLNTLFNSIRLLLIKKRAKDAKDSQ